MGRRFRDTTICIKANLKKNKFSVTCMSFWSLHFRCLYRVSFWAQARFTLIFLHHFYLKSLQGRYFLYTTAICQVFLSGCGSLFQTYQTLQRPHRGKIGGKKKKKTHPQITDCLCRGGISIFLCMEKETILFSNALKSRRYACGQFWVFESLMRQSLSATCAPVWFNKAQTNIELFFFLHLLLWGLCLWDYPLYTRWRMWFFDWIARITLPVDL